MRIFDILSYNILFGSFLRLRFANFDNLYNTLDSIISILCIICYLIYIFYPFKLVNSLEMLLLNNDHYENNIHFIKK